MANLPSAYGDGPNDIHPWYDIANKHVATAKFFNECATYLRSPRPNFNQMRMDTERVLYTINIINGDGTINEFSPIVDRYRDIRDYLNGTNERGFLLLIDKWGVLTEAILRLAADDDILHPDVLDNELLTYQNMNEADYINQHIKFHLIYRIETDDDIVYGANTGAELFQRLEAFRQVVLDESYPLVDSIL